MRITVPDALRDGSTSPLVGWGPYVIEHNGVRELGSMLYQYPDNRFTVQDMSRVLEIDDEYSIKVEGDALVFRNPERQSTIRVRPVEPADKAWLFPDAISDREMTQEEIEEAAFQLLDFPTEEDAEVPITAAVFSGLPEAHTFITLDETGKVLEFCRSDDTGIYVRSNNQWFLVDPNAEEEDVPTVWNREWVDVRESALGIFDTADTAEQSLSRSEFEEYIIAQ